MSLFSQILDRLGFDKKEEEAPKPAPVPRSVSEDSAARQARLQRIVERREKEEMPMVDVMAKLDEMAKAKGMELNWKKSIADLLFVLDIDNSYENRRELAVELGCPEEKMADSAQMNTWLHTTVLEMIAENGGNIPQELFD
jgi:hypothetical protein